VLCHLSKWFEGREQPHLNDSFSGFKMGSSDRFDRPPFQNTDPGYAVNGKIMMSAIVCFFLVVLLVFLLHVYARWIWRQSARFSRRNRRRSAARRRRFHFAGLVPARLRNAGLDSAILETLPMFVYKSQNFTDGLDCAVCLCELEENEKARLLPNCKHSFHVECIDMWLRSHSTCPVCRSGARPELAPVLESAKTEQVSVTISGPIPSGSQDDLNSGQGPTASSGEEAHNLQNPVLSCDRQKQMNEEKDQGTSGGSRALIMPQIGIEIPKRPDGFSSFGEGHQFCSPNGSQLSSKSPGALLRSLTRMLSRDTERNQVFPTDHPAECDVENNGPTGP